MSSAPDEALAVLLFEHDHLEQVVHPRVVIFAGKFSFGFFDQQGTRKWFAPGSFPDLA